MAEQFTTSHIAEFPSKDDLVFGLDIGTRNVVGTVGFRDEDGFHVVAMSIREHKTRAMLDGQIHNIAHVAEVIAEVKEELEASSDFIWNRFVLQPLVVFLSLRPPRYPMNIRKNQWLRKRTSIPWIFLVSIRHSRS